MELIKNERLELISSLKKIDDLKEFLYSNNLDKDDIDICKLYKYFNKIKDILGNFNTDISYVSCLMAKDYLSSQFDLNNFDVSEKSQSASGIDIVVYTKDSQKIIAEIKTTSPYKITDFGANQIYSLRTDFDKLKNTKADFKFMFVTNQAAYNVLNKKYIKELDSIYLVLLEKKEYNNEIRLSQFADEKITFELRNRNCVEILVRSFKKAYEIIYGDAENFIVNIEYLKNENDISIHFFENKKIVEDVYVEKSEIELTEAKKIHISAKIGEHILIPFDKTLFTKEAVLEALKELYKNINTRYEPTRVFESHPNSCVTSTGESFSGWKPYYEEYKPFHHSQPKTKTEEEVDREYGAGYFDNGPNPFPFDNSDSEDDYGADSWA